MGYNPLPEWTDDPTDPSLRESEAPTQAETLRVSAAPTPRITTPTNMSIPTPIPGHVASAAATPARSLSSSADSPFGSVPPAVKGKFQDLDKFLDSESETEEEETDDEESEDERPVVRPVTAPPRSAIVPEYDETSSEEDDNDHDDGDTESDREDRDERAALYGEYR
jgi:AP-3 complex subunit beta